MAPREGAEGAGRAAPGAGSEGGGDAGGQPRSQAAAQRRPPGPRRRQSGADAPPGGAGGGRWEGHRYPASSRCFVSAWGARPPARGSGLPEPQGRAAAPRLLSSVAEFLPAVISPNRYSWGGVALSLRFRGDSWALRKPPRVRQLCGWLLTQRELKHGRGHRPVSVF